MVTKKFDQSLYDKYDGKDRELAKKFLVRLGYQPIDNPDTYGVDLIAYGQDGELRFTVEVEYKGCWHGSTFPFIDIQLPYRKRKLFDENDMYFFTFNHDFSYFFSIPKTVITDFAQVKVIPNKLVASGEQFYSIPVAMCTINKVEDDYNNS